MSSNEIDHTIHPYTVGRADCRVLPRSFKTLAEAEAYLAKQDKAALERGEFYLGGPERDEAATNRIVGAVCVSPEPIAGTPAAADPAAVDSQSTPTPIEPRLTRSAWTRQIEELCRALEAQEGAHWPINR